MPRLELSWFLSSSLSSCFPTTSWRTTFLPTSRTTSLPRFSFSLPSLLLVVDRATDFLRRRPGGVPRATYSYHSGLQEGKKRFFIGEIAFFTREEASSSSHRTDRESGRR